MVEFLVYGSSPSFGTCCVLDNLYNQSAPLLHGSPKGVNLEPGVGILLDLSLCITPDLKDVLNQVEKLSLLPTEDYFNIGKYAQEWQHYLKRFELSN